MLRSTVINYLLSGVELVGMSGNKACRVGSAHESSKGNSKGNGVVRKDLVQVSGKIAFVSENGNSARGQLKGLWM